ncbi:hypothetical protein KR222_011050 [Zaprionus bogoriensis]|nr:hypothetical protein KR222_011050 [Zaprionus bogoriensis]
MHAALAFTSMRLATLALLLLMLLQLCEAKPHPWWGHNEANYDASLDPLVWSQPFVQDIVRRPRISRNYHPQKELELSPRRRQSPYQHLRPQRRGKNHHNNNNNNNYRKYQRRRRKLLLQTRC